MKGDRRIDYVSLPMMVPIAHVFATEDDGPFDVYEFGGSDRFEIDFDQLETILVGDCRGCGRKVDHRRGVGLGEGDRLPVEVATYVHPERDPTAGPPVDVRTAIDAGWGIAPVCDECQAAAIRRRFESFTDQWRREGKIR